MIKKLFQIQILFIYVRTLNIKYTADDKIWPAVWTSGLIGLFWLIAIYIGVSSLMQGHIMPAAGHLFGGMVGTYIGMKYDLLTKK